MSSNYMHFTVFYLFIPFIFDFSTGESSFSTASGKKGYCRAAEYCPQAQIYSGPDCSCKGEVCCIETGIARKKCEEYGQYVFQEDYGAALMARRSLVKESQCKNEAVPLIVGGVSAGDKEFPHMVAIGFGAKNAIKYMCGGSLISEQFVLTAAHCDSSPKDGPAKWAKLGALNVNDTDDGDAVQDLEIVERISHPKYKPPLRYHDIALFKLKDKVRISGFVRPACLTINPEMSSVITNATATGWGKLDYSESKGSQILMKVQLHMISGPPCQKTYKVDIGPGRSLANGILKSQFCAGDLKGGKDTCQGDSGGPLQVTLISPFCMYGILGVTSFGKFCGFANTPAIYTKVAMYVPWIESIVWPK